MHARLESSPQLVSWVVRVADIRGSLQQVDQAVGEAVPLTRGELSWLISVTNDGSMPFDGAYPAFIEWPSGPLPSLRMADLGCRLERLAVVHPEDARLSTALDSILTDERVVVSRGDAVQIRATITTPSGRRELT